MESKKGYITKSKTDSHSTPKYIRDYVEKKWGTISDYDPCPLNDNPTKNGLTENWDTEKLVFVNPPYSSLKTTKKHLGWIEKAFQQSQRGCTVVLLIPARTDTQWFHDFCLPFGEIEWIRGRIKFDGCNGGSAPFPSIYVVFRPKTSCDATL